ncbi:DUF308 domain-containing protein [Agromyces atrinae]|uniref:Uncharacterized membrane protein HdeD (DUF308 family) n=1 Tax=Agromyces atrinae TaxID=592376 RepID=A0A4Q2M8Z3_9MICO|nr:DUF308 domain-containing protein [Agromyces atrinae]MCI2958654.1 DUF308 domain-containing protein [Agromyces atrinae]NYD66127.1 uncharacterized membrane protein HdeD (DUF308 family) [Agromyces atrinae]RXZ86471.1 hypothetical protein ESP50_08675 [Agromyces atrinae]
MSSTQPSAFASFSLNGKDLTKSAISAIRVALGVSGVVALIIGIIITVWTKEAALVLTALIGVYFIVAGLAYLGIGLFAKGLSGGARALDIILGVLLVISSIIVFTNLTDSAVILGIFLGVFIGVLWIVEGVVALVQSGDSGSRGWAIFFGIVSLIAGIVVLFSPLWGTVVLFIFAGISLIVLGVLQIVRAFTFGKGVATV